ncbi:hypothetical protein BgiMline_000923 [Biomphalaria glabrata]|uniref:Uncharacterized protein LOC106050641 n=1 Tax=Biomphalaria glabrata TaxID=6526 RepID=A0A9U8DUS2_BIOGL|nr:uncharacterized protein LOC106050641 [Biomphalaria glabrata]KAI8768840.1 hypothetical protein BgiMline_000863 [Biomphalaria glabrata]KAI8789062.1 hypothetical protein BgiBS90_009320 [Biomphalaria glabrata]
MALEKTNNAKTPFNINSPVNKYDLLTLEQHKHGLTEEHILLAFQAFDELIPYLGVFTQIFQKLRADFIAAVYSDELTGTTDSSKEYVQRKPFFLLVKQDQDQKIELIEELKEQLEKVKKSLFEKHNHLSEALEELSKKDNEISDLILLQTKLKEKIEEQQNEMNKMESQMEEIKSSASFTEHQLACDISDLRDELEDAKNEIKELSVFKKSYDDIYFAFMDKSMDDDEIKQKKQSVVSTKRANLENELESAQRLEEQILLIMNTMIEDYEKHVDAHRFIVMEKCSSHAETDAEQDLRELELDEANEELRHVQLTFQNSVANLLTELGLLEQHTGMLNEHLQMLEELKPTLIKKKQEMDQKWKGDSVLSAGLEVDDSLESHFDPFIAQEQIFSKYSAMLYTSNNQGKTFEELKDAKYCASCGEKTLICPHKLTGPEKIFILPHHCSHIKITRPRVRINKQATKNNEKLDQQWELFQYKNSITKSHTESSTSNTDISRESSLLGMTDTHIIHTTQKLWEDYNKRTTSERKIPRFLTLEQTQAIIEQFLGYLIWTDEFLTEVDVDESILDLMYRYMHFQYMVADVANMAAHDFLSAITQYSGVDKTIQLLGHVLIGNLDASCLRYVLLICDFITAVDWKEVEDFRAFATAIYPFLNEDDFENLQMSYTSYSENKISQYHVASFLINLIIKHREPRFRDMEIKLVQYQGQENGHLTEVEFKEATENLVPLCNEQIRNRLFIQSLKSSQLELSKKAVPIMKLAHIAAFLTLEQISNVIRENVLLKLKERRAHLKPLAIDAKEQRASNEGDYNGSKLVTMTYMRQLAANINRQFKQEEDSIYS